MGAFKSEIEVSWHSYPQIKQSYWMGAMWSSCKEEQWIRSFEDVGFRNGRSKMDWIA